MAAHMGQESASCHIWVGAQTGILKGVNLKKNGATNYTDLTSLEKEKEITSMCWADEEENQVLLGLRNGTVRTFQTTDLEFLEDFVDCGVEEGVFKGMATIDNDRLVTCQASGLVRVWERGNPEVTGEVKAGDNVSRMRQHPMKRHVVATGGKENALKVWDLEKPAEPIFKAKNVRNDFLDLRVPIWDNDMQFLTGSSKIVTCTGHHQVRVYDPSSSQRRPVMNIEFDEYPLMALAVVPGDNSVIVGNSQGKMAELDLRKGCVARIYKGFAGSIRDISCHPTLPLVASCGLDRFVRIHNTQDGLLKNKVYLKSRLNCLLFSSKDFTKDEDAAKTKEGTKKADVDEESEEIWQRMKTISEEAAPRNEKKRRKAKEDGGMKKKKSSARKGLRSSSE